MKREEYNEGLNAVYGFFRQCRETMIEMCKKHGGHIDLNMDADECSYTMMAKYSDVNLTPIYIELNTDQTDVYVSMIDSYLAEEGKYPKKEIVDFDFCELGNDLIVISDIMECLFEMEENNKQ